MSFRPLPVLTVCTVLALALTVWLGFWQWSRYQEKLVRAAAPPPPIVSLENAAPAPDAACFVFANWNGPGWRVFIPTRSEGRLFFVDVGFVPGVEVPSAAPMRDVGAPVTTGVRVDTHPPGRFTATPDSARRAFYRVDLPAMAAASAVPGALNADYYIAAPYRTADGAVVPNPFAVVAEPLPPARHLGYAVTWWGLAASLIGVYLALHARLGRLKLQ